MLEYQTAAKIFPVKLVKNKCHENIIQQLIYLVAQQVKQKDVVVCQWFQMPLVPDLGTLLHHQCNETYHSLQSNPSPEEQERKFEQTSASHWYPLSSQNLRPSQAHLHPKSQEN